MVITCNNLTLFPYMDLHGIMKYHEHKILIITRDDLPQISCQDLVKICSSQVAIISYEHRHGLKKNLTTPNDANKIYRQLHDRKKK